MEIFTNNPEKQELWNELVKARTALGNSPEQSQRMELVNIGYIEANDKEQEYLDALESFRKFSREERKLLSEAKVKSLILELSELPPEDQESFLNRIEKNY